MQGILSGVQRVEARQTDLQLQMRRVQAGMESMQAEQLMLSHTAQQQGKQLTASTALMSTALCQVSRTARLPLLPAAPTSSLPPVQASISTAGRRRQLSLQQAEKRRKLQGVSNPELAPESQPGSASGTENQ